MKSKNFKNKPVTHNNIVSFSFILLLFIQIIIVSYSCTENSTEQKNEPCLSIDIVPIAPFDSPAWHPNGKIIGFNHTPLDSITYPYGEHCAGRQYFNYDSSGFWLINIDGKNMHRILPYKLQTPAWSPDGKWIAFVKNANIYKMPFDANNMKFDTTQIIQLTFEGRNFSLDWSPDGEWIVYDSNKDSPNGMNFIWKMKNDGSKKTRIAYDPEKGEIREPSWSSDSSKIVHIRYSKDFNTDASEIFVMNENGNNVKRLTFNNFTDDYPKYSPKGNLISFVQFGTNLGVNIMLMEADGKNMHRVTSESIYDTYSWDPIGEKIVYVKYKSDNWGYDNGTMWIVDIFSSRSKQITYNQRK